MALSMPLNGMREDKEPIIELFVKEACRPAELGSRTHPPFITFNNEVKTDVNKIEEFLEDVLCPPKAANSVPVETEK